MTVLVTGGAGYIGARACHALAARSDEIVIVDDLVTGDVGRVSRKPLVSIDFNSDEAPAVLAAVMIEHSIDAVIHFAARKQVGESMLRPAWYHQQNVGRASKLAVSDGAG